MLIARYKTIIVMLLTLVFTGQVLASAILSCQGQPAETVVSVNMVDHSQHMNMVSPSVDPELSIECCAKGNCNFGGCTATAVLPAIQSLIGLGLTSSPYQYNEQTINQRTTPILRPPISA